MYNINFYSYLKLQVINLTIYEFNWLDLLLKFRWTTIDNSIVNRIRVIYFSCLRLTCVMKIICDLCKTLHQPRIYDQCAHCARDHTNRGPGARAHNWRIPRRLRIIGCHLRCGCWLANINVTCAVRIQLAIWNARSYIHNGNCGLIQLVKEKRTSKSTLLYKLHLYYIFELQL